MQRVEKERTGLFSMLFLLLRPFLMWLFKALESNGFSSSKLQRSSPDTDMTAPQLSNSPQYYLLISIEKSANILPTRILTFGAENTVTSIRSLKNSYPSSTTMWALHTKSKSCLCKNSMMTFFPKQ